MYRCNATKKSLAPPCICNMCPASILVRNDTGYSSVMKLSYIRRIVKYDNQYSLYLNHFSTIPYAGNKMKEEHVKSSPYCSG